MNFDKITWSKRDVESMINAQMDLNQFIINNQFMLTQQVKDKFKQLQHDLCFYYIIKCNVCGDEKLEHITMQKDWHDEIHQLTLCFDCYNQFVINSQIGQYIKIDKF